MIKKVIGVILLSSLLLVVILQLLERNPATENSSKELNNTGEPKVGSKAPDFKLKTLNGVTVRLSNLKGKKVIVNFWATWCHPCNVEIPEINKFYKVKSNDVVILGVNVDPYSDVKGFVKKNKITFPILLDKEDKVNEQYSVITIPTTFFINAKGIIQNIYSGEMSFEVMKSYSSELK